MFTSPNLKQVNPGGAGARPPSCISRLVEYNLTYSVLNSILMSDSSFWTPKTVYYQFIAHLYNLRKIRILGQLPGPIARVLEGVGSCCLFSTLRLSILSRHAPKPARNSNLLKCYYGAVKQYHQKPTNPTVAREPGTVAGRDQKCGKALMNLYNIQSRSQSASTSSNWIQVIPSYMP